MNTERKALWAVRQSALPTVVRPCPDCSGMRHRPSGKIRVNANGKLLDVWLLLSCAACDRPRRCRSTNASMSRRWSPPAGWHMRAMTRRWCGS
ncbi:DUF1062 domain-containing protein [Peterkaempfera sp. SMS 1(5)a]|uniref:DUF1062 domain-containing protein n=1 Tax=Peterkaempfera podocarpi TaxID=3232308 RepID=UPI00366BC5E1